MLLQKQKLKFVKSLKFENEALCEKKERLKFSSGPILRNISGLNVILKKIFLIPSFYYEFCNL